MGSLEKMRVHAISVLRRLQKMLYLVTKIHVSKAIRVFDGDDPIKQ